MCVFVVFCLCYLSLSLRLDSDDWLMFLPITSFIDDINVTMITFSWTELIIFCFVFTDNTSFALNIHYAVGLWFQLWLTRTNVVFHTTIVGYILHVAWKMNWFSYSNVVFPQWVVSENNFVIHVSKVNTSIFFWDIVQTIYILSGVLICVCIWRTCINHIHAIKTH